MKKIFILLIVLLVLVLAVVLSLRMKNDDKKAEKVYVTHEMLIQQMEEMGKLEIVKYNIQDVMDYEKARRWLPNSRTTIKMIGEVTSCIDLTKINPTDVMTDGDSVSIVLPLPEICNYKVDHARSRVYNVEYGLWETATLVDEAYRQAEDHLYRQALKMGITDEGHENAVKILTPILHSLGFKRVNITFKAISEKKTLERNHAIQLEY